MPSKRCASLGRSRSVLQGMTRTCQNLRRFCPRGYDLLISRAPCGLPRRRKKPFATRLSSYRNDLTLGTCAKRISDRCCASCLVQPKCSNTCGPPQAQCPLFTGHLSMVVNPRCGDSTDPVPRPAQQARCWLNRCLTRLCAEIGGTFRLIQHILDTHLDKAAARSRPFDRVTYCQAEQRTADWRQD
jgi:hypothetical protein